MSKNQYEVLSSNENVKDFFSMVISKISEGVTFFKSNKKHIYFDKERMITFANNNSCITCGLKGTVVKYEKMKNCDHSIYGNYHVNFYGIRNGISVMMTVDHIVLKSLGGADHHSNYNTMCRDCNTRRGNKFEKLEDFIELNKKISVDEYLEEIRKAKQAKKHKKDNLKAMLNKLLRGHCFEYYRHLSKKRKSIESE